MALAIDVGLSPRQNPSFCRRIRHRLLFRRSSAVVSSLASNVLTLHSAPDGSRHESAAICASGFGIVGCCLNSILVGRLVNLCESSFCLNKRYSRYCCSLGASRHDGDCPISLPLIRPQPMPKAVRLMDLEAETHRGHRNFAVSSNSGDI